MVGSVPLTSIRSPSPVSATEGGEETKEEGDGDRTQSPKMESPIIATPQEDMAVQEPETVPLVVPAALFRPTSYHSMHIFVSRVHLSLTRQRGHTLARLVTLLLEVLFLIKTTTKIE